MTPQTEALDQLFAHPYLGVLLPRFEECLRDVDGRPLGEANAPDWALGKAEFDYRPCPYAGSRAGGSMNFSAMRQLGQEWPEILALLGLLRSAFVDRFPLSMNNLLLSRLAVFLTMFSGWLVETQSARWDTIPRRVSGLFKAAQGLYFTANDAMIRGGERQIFAPITVDRFMDHAEVNGVFRLGAHVCAGPTDMIRKFAQVAIDGFGTEFDSNDIDASALNLPAALTYAELRLQAQRGLGTRNAALAQAVERGDPEAGRQAIVEHRDACRVLQQKIAALSGRDLAPDLDWRDYFRITQMHSPYPDLELYRETWF